ncbi:MAG: signal peptidase I [Olsenella sp.]|nr:signal peptidase I [Olsenella sp.]
MARRNSGEEGGDSGSSGWSIPAWLDWVITIAIGIAVMLVVRAFVAEPFLIPSGSMLETIQKDDRVLGEKVSYRFTKPSRGDVVTFRDPERADTTLIKRVIATEGQSVNLVDGDVYVDGERLDEPYVLGKPTEPIVSRYSALLDAPISYPFTVPSGCVWVMGDNRTNSLDSRYFGSIPTDSVTSRAVVIFWPPSDFATL